MRTFNILGTVLECFLKKIKMSSAFKKLIAFLWETTVRWIITQYNTQCTVIETKYSGITDKGEGSSSWVFREDLKREVTF